MNAALLAVALSAVAAPAPAEEIKLPQGAPPMQVVAQVNKDGRIEVTQSVMVYRQEKRTRVVNVNGQNVAQEYVVTIVTPVTEKRLLPEKGLAASTAAGKEVPVKDLADKLKGPTIVFVAWDGKKVDPFFLKPLKPDTLVIVAPPPEPPPAGAGDKPPVAPAGPPPKEPTRIPK
ncbi:MAG TPA: hypothetical protein VFW33_13695 [Gemmataceae bacterium]|nr:hypothetical protein [Gemmataceae bacterium]